MGGWVGGIEIKANSVQFQLKLLKSTFQVGWLGGWVVGWVVGWAVGWVGGAEMKLKLTQFNFNWNFQFKLSLAIIVSSKSRSVQVFFNIQIYPFLKQWNKLDLVQYSVGGSKRDINIRTTTIYLCNIVILTKQLKWGNSLNDHTLDGIFLNKRWGIYRNKLCCQYKSPQEL